MSEQPKSLLDSLTDHDRRIIREFINRVNARAEVNMLKTGKLEGSHHAAIKSVCAELKI